MTHTTVTSSSSIIMYYDLSSSKNLEPQWTRCQFPVSSSCSKHIPYHTGGTHRCLVQSSEQGQLDKNRGWTEAFFTCSNAASWSAVQTKLLCGLKHFADTAMLGVKSPSWFSSPMNDRRSVKLSGFEKLAIVRIFVSATMTLTQPVATEVHQCCC